MNRAKFETDFLEFNRLGGNAKAIDRVAVLDEDGPSHTSHDYDATYLQHCAWAARQLAATRPKYHIDFGSYVYFAAICAAFVQSFYFVDIRDLGITIPGLVSAKGDLLSLPYLNDSFQSLSSLHTLEHVGLGRYGDKLDPDGHWKALAELIRILAPGGKLLLVLPMNKDPRTCFNAHRILSLPDVRSQIASRGARIERLDFIHGSGLLVGSEPDGDYTGCFVVTK